MHWLLYYLVAGAAFDHLAGVHDEGVFGEVARAGDVVGDKEQGQAFLVFQAQQQVEDIQADGYVEHGDGFIGQQHFGLHGQRPSDRDALALAAAQLMRKFRDELFSGTQVDAVQQGEDLLCFLSFVAGVTVDAQRTGQVIAHIVYRVERREGVL